MFDLHSPVRWYADSAAEKSGFVRSAARSRAADAARVRHDSTCDELAAAANDSGLLSR